MIRIVENDSVAALLDYCKGDPFGCRLLAAYRSYGLGESFAQFWLQLDEKENITAAIGSLDNGVTVCTRGGCDEEEIDSFVHMLAGENGALRPVRTGETADGVVMRLDRSLVSGAGSEADASPLCEDLYTVIENCPGLGFDVPPFSVFYPDMFRRMRSGTLSTALIREAGMPVSCAAMHIAANVGLLTMCATVPAHEGKGYASACVRSVISRQPQDMDIYVMCLPHYCSHYEQLGFRVVGGFIN